jgi:hypothetical protein
MKASLNNPQRKRFSPSKDESIKAKNEIGL